MKVRALAGALSFVFAASCARTGLWDPLPSGDVDASTSSGSGGAGALGGSAPTGGVGGTRGADDAGASAGTGGSLPLGALCPSLAEGAPSRVVLAYVSREELWLARVDGSVIRVNALATNGARIFRKDNFLLISVDVETGTMLSLVDFNGNLLWSDVEPFFLLDPARIWVSERGEASVGVANSPGFVVLASGSPFRLSGSPLGPPDVNGWVPIGSGNGCGFVNVVTGDGVRAPLPLARPLVAPIARQGLLVYLAMSGGGPGVAVVSPDDERFFPIPNLDLEGAAIAATDAGYVVTEGGFPRAIVAGLSGVRLLEPVQRNASFSAAFHFAGDFGLVVEGQVPRYAVGLDAARVARMAPVPYAPRNERTSVLFDGPLALGSHGGVPLFLADQSGAVTAAELSRLSPLRAMDATPCSSTPALLEGGLVAVPLRDERSGAAYVGRLAEFPWTRVGRSVSRVASLEITRRPRSLSLVGDSGGARDCNDAIFPDFVPDDALLGDSVQVITPQGETIFENTLENEVVIDDSGACGVTRGVAYDFVARVRAELPADATQVTFLTTPR